jgi:hypothetical protein
MLSARFLSTPAIAEKVIEKALAGDMTAAAIVLGMAGRGIIR